MDYVKKPFINVEFLARVKSALQLKASWDEQNSQIKRIEAVAMLDDLTNIYNRRYLEKTLQKAWAMAMRKEHPISMFMIDIDFFKGYNDSNGHPAGDECLRRVAKVFSTISRRPYDIVARYGGEEFAIVLPDTGAKNAYGLAELVRETVESLKIEHPLSTVSNFVTISLGLATMIPERYSNHDVLIKAADDMLYKAKEEGRNKTVTMSGEENG